MSEIDYDVYGTVVAKAWFANATLTLLDVGIQLFMCLYGLSVFLETPKELRRGRAPYIVMSYAIFILSSLTAALDSYAIFKDIWNAKSGKDMVVMDISQVTLWRTMLASSAATAYILIGDGLLVYRCYAIWKDRWYVTALPILTYIVTIAIGIRSLVEQAFDSSDRVFTGTFTLLSVADNILVTGLISLRLIRARRALMKALPNQNLSAYSTAATILIEAAIPLAIFGPCYGILAMVPWVLTTASASKRAIAELTFSLLYFSFAALSPQMIIFKVTTGRSWASDPRTVGSSYSNPIVFAHSAASYQHELGTDHGSSGLQRSEEKALV